MRRVTEIIRLRRPSRRQAIIAVALALLAAVAAAIVLLGDGQSEGGDSPCAGGSALYWYDPMIPQERYPGPGKSSMNMELVPKCANESAQGGVTVSPAMQQNLGIRTTEARFMDLAPRVQAVGRVEVDQRLINEVQTLTAGFVEQLTVRAEGETVQAGQRLASVYSPELLAAQNEYKALLSTRSRISADLRDAARARLRLLGLPEAMIRRLERGGAPQRTYPVFAPASGVVTAIGARPGAQVTPGQSILTLAGLSRVWVVAQVPEIQLGNIGVGRPVEITFAAYPGEVWNGRIDYIFPTLDPQARTARARITLDNPGLRIKEGMFADVTILGTGGMALVVPSEAIIDTGRRKVILVRRNDAFIPVEVVTGREAGEMTQVLRGLEPGAQVVVSGQFLIDSEASLSGIVQRLNANAPKEQDPGLAVATGVIQTLNTDEGKVTIEHGPVPMMNWPPMTMTFTVEKPAMLRGFARGARVEFAFSKRGEAFVITSIRRAPKE